LTCYPKDETIHFYLVFDPKIRLRNDKGIKLAAPKRNTGFQQNFIVVRNVSNDFAISSSENILEEKIFIVVRNVSNDFEISSSENILEEKLRLIFIFQISICSD